MCLMPQVEFEWDDANEEHIAAHGIQPDDVEEAISDPRRIRKPARRVRGEARWGIVGSTEAGRVLSIIYTRRAGRLRVVSAWDAVDATADEQCLEWTISR